jgi:hypothetical protein
MYGCCAFVLERVFICWIIHKQSIFIEPLATKQPSAAKAIGWNGMGEEEEEGGRRIFKAPNC